MPHTAPRTDEDRRHVLTQAVLRAAALLGLNQARISEILGLSAPMVSRMAHGTYRLDDARKEWEHAALFVRLFRSLDALVGSNDAAARDWLRGHNSALGGQPVELIRSTEGLVRVVHYLDAARGRV
jgi:transcriptional regulator with XRE-family HTH domain